MGKKMKIQKMKVLFYVTLGCIGFGILLFTYKNYQQHKMQEDIAKEIIRFHIIANSDTAEDQNLKLEVKDVVVKKLQKKLKYAKNIDQARAIIRSELGDIEKTADKEMNKRGYDYRTHAYLTHCMFPVKLYGDMVFPAGKYEALRVELGRAEGKNWWCVMFPTLCFVNGTYSVVPDQSKAKLKQKLTREEYNSLLMKNQKRSPKIKIEFKVANWWKSFEKREFRGR
jgi:stage II sporulation protein R